MTISKKKLKALKTGEIRDKRVPGLIAARRRPGGQIIFYMELTKDKTRHRVNIGKWKIDYHRVKDARQAGKFIRSRMMRPDWQPDSRIKTMPLKNVLTAYYERIAKKTKPATLAIYKKTAARHILPALGRKKMHEINPTDGHNLYNNLTPGTGRMVHAVMAGLLKYAAANQLIRPELPGQWPRPPSPAGTRQKKHPLPSPAALGRLYETWHRLADTPDKKNKAALFTLLLLTGARRNEIARLQWSDIDTGRALARLPDSKTGPRTLPLPAAAINLIADLPRTGKNLFGSGNPWHYWNKCRQAAGLPHLRIHDLRHIFAQSALEAGASPHEIAGQLGHSSLSATDIYARLVPGHKAANIAAAAITAILKGYPNHVSPNALQNGNADTDIKQYH